MIMTYEKIYKILRVFIYAIPAVSIVAGLYLILFPVEDFKYYSAQPKISKFEPAKSADGNEISFGVFPLRKHRYADLEINFKKASVASCQKNPPTVTLEKTYQAFLFPEGPAISSAEELKNLLYENNSTRYPNGTLLHLKPTDEVFVISEGKRILFPGPEIFFAFGYSFDNLIDVDQATLDQYPEADPKTFLWTLPHPDGTIFEGFPSHSFYLTLGGQKRLITNEDILKEAWPEYYAIPIDDLSSENRLSCQISEKDYLKGATKCTFDTDKLPLSIGKYYLFALEYPESCKVANVHIDSARIDFIAEKSYSTVKDTIRTIFASILNRYIRQ